MVFLDVVVLAVVAGLLLGGDLSKLASVPIRHIWLVFLALALQIAAFPPASLPWSTPDVAARGLWLVSYAALIVAAATNFRLPGIPVLAAGVACNVAAILNNDGRMPARPSALAAAGRHYTAHDNSVALARPHLAWLVDRWAVPGWLPMGNVFSVGDLLIALGAAILVVAAMQPRALGRLRRAESEACPSSSA